MISVLKDPPASDVPIGSVLLSDIPPMTERTSAILVLRKSAAAIPVGEFGSVIPAAVRSDEVDQSIAFISSTSVVINVSAERQERRTAQDKLVAHGYASHMLSRHIRTQRVRKIAKHIHRRRNLSALLPSDPADVRTQCHQH